MERSPELAAVFQGTGERQKDKKDHLHKEAKFLAESYHAPAPRLPSRYYGAQIVGPARAFPQFSWRRGQTRRKNKNNDNYP